MSHRKATPARQKINPLRIRRELALFLLEAGVLRDDSDCSAIAAWFVRYAREEGVI